MGQAVRVATIESTDWICEDHCWAGVTSPGVSFQDLTSVVEDLVRRSGLDQGWVNVQVRHTTAALVVNEAEPLLLRDLARTLEALVPRSQVFEHDDFERRVGPLPPDEPVNGHSHCKSLMLSPSVTVNVGAGRLLLGQWQRLMLVELDGGRPREVSMMAMGRRAASPPPRRLRSTRASPSRLAPSHGSR